MLGSWSTTIDPIQLADKGARLIGELPMKGMRRLAEVCRDERGSISVDLQFAHDASDNLRVMYGRIAAHVNLTCQRCMGEYAVVLTTEPRLLVLRPGEREDLIENEDALIVEQPLTLGQIVEDELLLEVPMVPMHPVAQCPAGTAVQAREAEEKESARANPFAVLEQLKRRDR